MSELPETTPQQNPLPIIPYRQYDNEWVKFLQDLSENQSVPEIVTYISTNTWSPRQKNTIMAYARIILGRGLSTTLLTSHTDLLRVYDDKALIDADLPLGLTRFDITPEFNILIGLISLHFGLELRKSKNGFFVKRIGTQRTEVIQEEDTKQKTSLYSELKQKVGFT